MADQRIQYTEQMVGAGHPSLGDTLNRLPLISHNSDGYPKLFAAQVHKNGVDQAGVVDLTTTKVTFSTLAIDPGAGVLVFDDANDRLTPKIAGKWMFHGNVQILSLGGEKPFTLRIQKNGGATLYEHEVSSGYAAGNFQDLSCSIRVIMDMNGTTDYAELFARHNHGSNRSLAGGVTVSWFEAVFLGA